jgi:rare lipoprotein A
MYNSESITNRRVLRRLFSFLILLVALQLTGCASDRRPEHLGDIQVGMASWYGGSLDGKPTASGERFHKNAFTAAHRTLPFNTIIVVENLKNGMRVKVRINDRGPFRKGRILDLSEAAAHALQVGGAGVIPVQLQVVEPY